MATLLLMLAFSALSSALPLNIDVEKRSTSDSDSDVPDVYKVGILHTFQARFYDGAGGGRLPLKPEPSPKSSVTAAVCSSKTSKQL